VSVTLRGDRNKSTGEIEYQARWERGPRNEALFRFGGTPAWSTIVITWQQWTTCGGQSVCGRCAEDTAAIHDSELLFHPGKMTRAGTC